MFCARSTSVLTVRRSEGMRDKFIRKKDLTCETGIGRHFPCTTEETQLVENKLDFVTDALLLCCTEIYDLEFSGWSVCWSSEYLNVELLSSGTFPGAGRSTNWLSASCVRKLWASLARLSFDKSYIVRVCDQCEDFGAYWRNLGRGVWTFLSIFVLGWVRTIQVTSWTWSWSAKAKISIIWLWRTMKRCVRLGQNRSNLKIVDVLHIFINNSF